MRMIGFSTGALTLGDYRHALRILADKEVNAVELSALRQEELKPLVEDLENLDLRKFQYIAFHAPSSLESSFEGTALELLEQVAGVSIERARYRKEPTLIGDPTDDPADRYARQENDTRFVEQFPRPGDYVLLSTGVRDTGLSSDESREDRYRPFENLGVDSEWTVEISRRDNMTDIATVADFMMLCEVTGRDGGASLQEAARAAAAKQSPSQGLQLSMRQQYAGASGRASREGLA